MDVDVIADRPQLMVGESIWPVTDDLGAVPLVANRTEATREPAIEGVSNVVASAGNTALNLTSETIGSNRSLRLERGDRAARSSDRWDSLTPLASEALAGSDPGLATGPAVAGDGAGKGQPNANGEGLPWSSGMARGERGALVDRDSGGFRVDGPGSAASGADAVLPFGSVGPAPAQTQRLGPITGVPRHTVVRQIERALDDGIRELGRTIRMELEPEGLGAIRLRVELGAAGLTVHITAEQVATHDLVQATLPLLTQACQDRGLTIDQVLADLMRDSSTMAGGAGFEQAPRQNRGWETGSAPRATRFSAEVKDELSRSGPREVSSSRVDYHV